MQVAADAATNRLTVDPRFATYLSDFRCLFPRGMGVNPIRTGSFSPDKLTPGGGFDFAS